MKNTVVVGNCQSRPVAQYLTEMSGGVLTCEPLVAHLSTPGHELSDLAVLDAADIILSQPIADSFHAAHLATSRLRERYADKLVTWPNLFFVGQTPDIVTIRRTDGQLVSGPLASYQSAGVMNCWSQDKSVDDTVAFLTNDLPFSAGCLRENIDKSITAMRQRDRETDVDVTDYIISSWQHQRLFFMFNHPSSHLLIELCNRLCRHCDIPVQKALVSESCEEPLGRLTAPMTNVMAHFLGLTFPVTDACRGQLVDVEGDAVKLGENTLYSFPDFVLASYRALDLQMNKGESYSMTPAYSVALFAAA